MADLVAIIGAGGEILRKVTAEPGQTIRLQPGEERVVFLHVDPSSARIQITGDRVKVSVDGQEAVIFWGFLPYLEDGTQAFTFGGQDGAPAANSSKSWRSQGTAPEDPEGLAEFEAGGGSGSDALSAGNCGGSGGDALSASNCGGSVSPGPFEGAGPLAAPSIPPAFARPSSRGDALASGSAAYGGFGGQKLSSATYKDSGGQKRSSATSAVPDNRGPKAGNDMFGSVDDALAAEEAEPRTIKAKTLLANDAGEDKGALAIIDVTMDAAFGKAWLDENGDVMFILHKSLARMPEGQTQDIEFTYTVSDGQNGTDTATVTLTVVGTQFGDDVSEGSEGDDTMLGGVGDDMLSGRAGNDTLLGGVGDDTLLGGAGKDTLLGGVGKDTLLGGAGKDTLLGGAGDDTLSGGAGRDIIEGGGGTDTVDYSAAIWAIVVRLWLGKAMMDGYGSRDDLIDIDSVIGSRGSDDIVGNDNKNTLSGGKGRDELTGLGGDDTLDGGDDDDTLDGGDGDDTLKGGDGADIFVWSGGHDLIRDFNGKEGDVLDISDIFGGGADLTLALSGDHIVLQFDSDRNGFQDASITLENAARRSGEDGTVGHYGSSGDLNTALKELLGISDSGQDVIL